jgi:hypothetical protein
MTDGRRIRLDAAWGTAGVAVLAAIAGAACSRAPLTPTEASSAGGGGGLASPAGGAGGGTAGRDGAASGSGADAATAPTGAGGRPNGPPPPGAAANPRYVFVSSTAFEAGTLGGLDGADSKCQALASTAGLRGTYRAWLSDRTGSPSTRFLRGGGPFLLVDGSLVAESWDVLTSGTLRHAIDLDESGGPPPPNPGHTCGWAEFISMAFTGTSPDGSPLPGDGTCSNWSDPNAIGPTCGLVSSQSQWSLVGSGGPCTQSAAIYCFEQEGPDLASDAGAMDAAADAGAAPSACPDACAPGPKRVFVTSQTYSGNLGGLEGADAKCQALARAAGLAGTYLAWLSDLAGSPATRFSRAGRPYLLVGGNIVADDWSSLTSGMLRHAIDETETGGLILPGPSIGCGGAARAWTNTRVNGTLAAEDESCGDWTDALSSGTRTGDVTSQQVMWTELCAGGDCAGPAALYCFEQ